MTSFSLGAILEGVPAVVGLTPILLPLARQHGIEQGTANSPNGALARDRRPPVGTRPGGPQSA